MGTTKFFLFLLAFCVTASAETQYYLGEAKTFIAGAHTSSAAILVKRDLRPEEGLIEVEGLVVQKDTPTQKHTTFFSVKEDGAFTLTTPSGNYTGKGRFTQGAPWKWTNWEYRVEFPNGVYYTANDALTEAGISVNKTYFRGEEELQRMEYLVKPISAALHKILSDGLAD